MMLDTAKHIAWQQLQAERAGACSVALPVLAREYPVCLRPFGAMIYQGLAIPPVRRNPPTFGRGGESIRFVRCRHYSGLCVTASSTIVVHSAIRAALESIAHIELAPAECVGILDIDPLDVEAMDELSGKFPSSPSADALCRYAGRITHENHWWEVLAPRWHGDVSYKGTLVDIDLQSRAKSDEYAKQRILWP